MRLCLCRPISSANLEDNDSGMSTGALAGIIVGVTVGVLLLFTAVVIAVMKASKRPPSAQQKMIEVTSEVVNVSGMRNADGAMVGEDKI